MTTNTKRPVPYVARLARESAKFGVRVGGIVGGAALSALWATFGRSIGGTDDGEREPPRTALDVPVWDDPDYVHNAYNHDEWLDGR